MLLVGVEDPTQMGLVVLVDQLLEVGDIMPMVETL